MENSKLYAGWKMSYTKLHPEKLAESETSDKKQFLEQASCV